MRTLDRTFAAARRGFLAGADTAGARVSTLAHPASGSGEELTADLAEVGPNGPAPTLMVVSGTHGVEGFAGSALQQHWLVDRAASLPPGVRLLALHGLNPVGFARSRRVNEHNVDLNRNFIDWDQPPPSNPGYDGLADLLVPPDWSPATQHATTAALLEQAEAIGLDRMQAVITSGQWDHPNGLYFGGQGPSWSYHVLHELCEQRLGDTPRLVVVDLHTGLGPWGHGELISSEPTDSIAHRRAVSTFGDVKSMLDGESVSAALTGDWLAWLPRQLPRTEVTAVALEFGTVDRITVLQALRADAWLFAHGDPASSEAAAIRAQLRAAFADDAPAWLARLRDRFDEVMSQAISALS